MPKILKIILTMTLMLAIKIASTSILNPGFNHTLNNGELYNIGNGDRWLANLSQRYDCLSFFNSYKSKAENFPGSEQSNKANICHSPLLYQVSPLTGAIVALLSKDRGQDCQPKSNSNSSIQSFFSPIWVMAANLDIMERGKRIVYSDQLSINDITILFIMIWLLKIVSFYLLLDFLLSKVVMNNVVFSPYKAALTSAVLYGFSDIFRDLSLGQYYLIDIVSFSLVLLFWGWIVLSLLLKHRRLLNSTINHTRKIFCWKYAILKLSLGLIIGFLYLNSGFTTLLVFVLSIFILIALQNLEIRNLKVKPSKPNEIQTNTKQKSFLLPVFSFIIIKVENWATILVALGIIWWGYGFSLVEANNPFLPYRYILMSFSELGLYLRLPIRLDADQLLADIYLPFSEVWFEFLRYSYSYANHMIRFIGVEWANDLRIKFAVIEFLKYFTGNIAILFSCIICFLYLLPKIHYKYQKLIMIFVLIAPIFLVVLSYSSIGDLHYGDKVNIFLQLIVAVQLGFIGLAINIIDISGFRFLKY